MMGSCRVDVSTECVVNITLVVTLGSVPVIAIFLAPNGQHPASMQIKDAIMVSPTVDPISDTRLICNLKPGKYIISYGLQDTNQADAQLMFYTSSLLKFFYVCLLKNKRGMQIGAQLLDDVGIVPYILYTRKQVLCSTPLKCTLDEEIFLIPLHLGIEYCNDCLSKSISFNAFQ